MSIISRECLHWARGYVLLKICSDFKCDSCLLVTRKHARWYRKTLFWVKITSRILLEQQSTRLKNQKIMRIFYGVERCCSFRSQRVGLSLPRTFAVSSCSENKASTDALGILKISKNPSKNSPRFADPRARFHHLSSGIIFQQAEKTPRKKGVTLENPGRIKLSWKNTQLGTSLFPFSTFFFRVANSNRKSRRRRLLRPTDRVVAIRAGNENF